MKARSVMGASKSVPVANFSRLAQARDARLLDLQYGDVSEERRAFEADHPGVLRRLEGLDLDDDFDGVACAMVACGEVVTSSNAAAHLAGAIGAPTTLVYLRAWPPVPYWSADSGGRAP